MLVKRRKQVGKEESLKGLNRAKFAAKEPRKKNSLKDKKRSLTRQVEYKFLISLLVRDKKEE
jgi:hypothetical protein